MESLSPQVVSASKLPILNPNEFDLWKMRIEQLARKNELKTRATLLMALPYKHLLKFNIHKDAKTLMEAIKKRNKTHLEDQRLDDLFNSLKIYEAEVKSSSTTSTTTQNIAFVSSQNTDNTNESVSAVASISSASTKVYVFALPNQIDTDDLEKIDLKWQMAILTMRARRFLQRTGRNLGANGTNSIRFDMSKVECYNCHMRGHFARECGSPKDNRNKETQRRNVLVEEEPTNYAIMAFISPPLPVLIMRDNALVELKKKFEKAEQERDELKLKLENFQTSSKNKSQLLASQTNDKTGLGNDNQVFNSFVFDCDEMFSSESDVSMPTSPIYDSQISLLPLSLKIRFLTQKMNLGEPCYEGKRMTHPNPQRHVVPIAVLTISRLVPLNAARPVNTVVPRTKVQHQGPITHGVNKAHSPIRRPINLRPSPQVSTFYQKVTTVKALQHALKDKGVIDSGCSRHMTGNMSYLSDFEEINGGYVAFGGNSKGGKITYKGKIRTGKLDFDDVYFVKKLKFNLFSVSQMCDKKNNVLFINTECIVLSFDFKLPDENHVLLRVPREHNMYNVDLKNNIPLGDLTCLFAKETLDESNLWHRRLGHINFKTMNKVVKGNQPNSSTGIQEHFDADKAGEGNVKQYVLFPLWYSGSKDPHNIDDDTNFEVKEPESEVHVSPSSSVKTKKHDDKTNKEAKGKSHVELSTGVRNLSEEFEYFFYNSINGVNAISTLVSAVGQNLTNSTNTFSAAGPSNTVVSPTLRKSSYVDPSQYIDDPNMPPLDDITYSDDEEDVGEEADFSNLETSIHVLVDFPKGKRAIGLKWVFRNKKDERGIVNRNKAQLVTQGHTQEEGINYEEVFAPVARIEGIRLFLVYASFMGFMVYQMDVKSAFLYETIKEEVYVCQPLGFKDLDYPDKVYKVVKALYGLHQAPRAWYETLANYLLENGIHRGKIDQTLLIKKQEGDIFLVQVFVDDIIFGSTNKDMCKAFEKLMKDKFQMSSMGELTFLGLQVKQKQDGTFISKDKYVAKILRKSMIGSLMYMASSRPDIMFAVCACARFQVTPKASHLHVIKRIFRYLKGKPHLGLWYPKDSPFNLVAYYNSDYACAILDRKSTTGGCQFLGCRLISWQCKNQKVVATSSTEAKYVADVSCYAQVLWIQNQLLDYGSPSYIEWRKLLLKFLWMLKFRGGKKSFKHSVARRRKGVVIRDPEEIATPSIIMHSKPKLKDKGKGIIAEEPKPLKKQAQIEKEKHDNAVLRYQALKKKPQIEAYARKNMMVYLKNIAGFKMDFFKCMSYDDIRPIFEKHSNSIVGFLEKREEQLEEEASKALKRKSKSSEQQAAKKQKLDEEVEELKTHLQIVPNNEDNVYTKATPLALKVPVVDYQIHTENNKPYYKIIRADGTH
nr:retrovirus-related Pol polyprotein from transposon TNT 1-94 [Tanacetum cinerariifolium]